MKAVLSSLLVAACFQSAAHALDSTPVKVVALKDVPTVDGELGEWGKDGWIKIPIKPAVDKSERAKLGLESEDKNYTGQIVVQLKFGVAKGRLYVAARWPDDSQDVAYKGWDWAGTRYTESRKREDMFAIRFHLDGDYDRSMLSGTTYKADVWLWSAARTNPTGFAEDMSHAFSASPIESAAEFSVQGIGTAYVKKQRDSGSGIYKVIRPPKEKTADHLPSFEPVAAPSGSVADVSAKGVWKAGYWNLELSRVMSTGNADDAVFKPGSKLLGQIAVFNRSADEHKSISEPLLIDFSGISAQ